MDHVQRERRAMPNESYKNVQAPSELSGSLDVFEQRVPMVLGTQWIDMCVQNQFQDVHDQIVSGRYCVRGDENPWMWDIIRCVARYGHVWFIEFILRQDTTLFKRGSELGVQNSSHGFQLTLTKVSLQSACERMGNVEMVQYLLDKGCDPDEKGFDGTSLFVAAKYGDLSMMKAFVVGGANPHRQKGSHGSSLLAVVASRDPWLDECVTDTPEAVLGRVRFVLEVSESYKIDIDQPDYNNNTALSCAAQCNNSAVVALLLGHGADKTIRNNAGGTPLDENIEDRMHCIWTTKMHIKRPTFGASIPTRDQCVEFTKVMKMLDCSRKQREKVLNALASVMRPLLSSR